ncbi:aminopeptidase P N-terminal domain-containing protein [Marinoscillum furvescens]|uniref:Xaa-Pro aminopeptidase n=1 Tax=Marinoscillum furvescens DSM 4134 TaxID=1122208 RepID=A0A3D9LGP0_MARFU|nr:aminopeptidase P N-terminal domain-containing protein [Marinoscillum furvescens]REE05787.1 Xaa-Pro aminopeptidase [Marinoscillum furvescens DSM 4134]
MRYRPIDNELFIGNRKRLVSRLKPNSVVVIHSNDIMPTNADGTMPFKQNSDLLYLSGIDQEESIVLLAPDHPDEKLREVLFLRETNEEIAIWEGHKFTKEEGTSISGIQNVKWTNDFEKVLYTVLAESEHIYLPTNEHLRNASVVETANDRFVKEMMSKFPLYKYERLSPILYDLRTIKSPIEVKLIEHACHITEQGFRRILDTVEPGVWEYEVEAEYAHVFLSNRSRGFAYTPIIAGGFNACVLHYIENNQQLKDGDLMLMDVGAEYANYNADMTRTIPVNGRFTKRQRQVYDAVLRVKTQATDLLKPGSSIPEYHKAVGELMTEELLDLGLLDKEDVKNQTAENPAYRKYFMHGTSHHLGLDVHDVGSVYKKFEPGMVFTVEPGIYIREENIGIRLEDDVVITETGHKNLMRNIPIHAEEIEDLMNSGK